MHSLRRIDPSHVFAAIYNILILTLLPIRVYVVLLNQDKISEDPGEAILYTNGVLAIFLTLVFFFPLSKLLDWLFQKVRRSRQHRMNSILLSTVLLILVLGLTFGSFTFATGIVLDHPLFLRIFSEQAMDPSTTRIWSLRFLLLGGIPLLLGGTTYWLFLQMSRQVIPDRRVRQGVGESRIVPAEIKSPETLPTGDQWKFLAHWSTLNLIGWAVGLLLAYLAVYLLNSFEILRPLRNSGWMIVMFICLPLGASIGMLQWYMLRNFGVNGFQWTIVTSLGWSIGCGIWAALYLKSMPFWPFDLSWPPFYISHRAINIMERCSIVTTLLGGAVISGVMISSFQFPMVRRFISRPEMWIKAYIFGFLLPAIIASIIYLLKSFLKRILFSLAFLPDPTVYEILGRRWMLVFWFSVVITAVSISILTGRVILNHSSMVSFTKKTG